MWLKCASAGGAAQSVPHKLIRTVPASYVTTQQTVMGYHLNQIYLEANEGDERMGKRHGRKRGIGYLVTEKREGKRRGRQTQLNR